MPENDKDAQVSVIKIAVRATDMRLAQKLYFKLIAQAKKTKLPADFAEAKKALTASQSLEREFDEMVQQVLENINE